MRHPAKMELFQGKLVVKDPQTCRLSNLEVATKYIARTKQLFFKHRANSPGKII
jgi:hypothetical protein